jgi:transposase
MLTMAEHESELADEQEDPFADLLPEARKSERTTKILALATFIASAKDRGNSWANICGRLEQKKGISVSPDHLRMIMERHADYKPKKRKRTNTNTKHVAKKNTKPSPKANAVSTAKANTKAAVASAEPEDRQPNTEAAAEPTVGPSSKAQPARDWGDSTRY